MSRFETPFLINVQYDSFDLYLSDLAKTGKKNYKFVEKHNEDLTYTKIPYDESLVKFFMDLWETQLIRGQRRKWGFPVQHVTDLYEKGILDLFVAYSSDLTILSMHFTERYNEYVYCHPPMYDKTISSDRYIAKYMWFNLIKYYINIPNVHWIDLGAGQRGTWKDLIKNRELYEDKLAYKWLYVPKHIKDDPDKELNYIVQFDIENKKLIIKE